MACAEDIAKRLGDDMDALETVARLVELLAQANAKRRNRRRTVQRH